MKLSEEVDAINSRKDFISFVRVLLRDLKEEPDSWENDSLDSFLEAIAAWSEDFDAYYINCGESVPEQPTWKVLAQILLAAKIYE